LAAQHAPALHARPGQQAIPAPPHAVQVLFRQAKLAAQEVRFRLAAVGQQVWPPPPHASHLPAMQVPRPMPQDVPAPVH
jgi:hypothetical protein